MLRLTFIILCLSLSGNINSQDAGKLMGEVFTFDKKLLEFVNVILYTLNDSTYIDYSVTDSVGYFKIENVAPGNYFIKASYLGLPEFSSDAIEIIAKDNLKIPDIVFDPPINRLEEVEVTATRPIIEMKADKLQFNVAGTINAGGGSALEILGKAPGVMVLSDETILLLGQEGVGIYINDKPYPLSGRELTDFLQSLQASEIDNIEIITNPSAKYDASGTAGIINIILKKEKKLGFNTLLNLGHSIGKKAWSKTSLNSNFNQGNINIFGYYGFSVGGYLSERELIQEQSDISYQQKNNTLSKWKGHNLKTGFDLLLGKNSELGLQLYGKFTDFEWLDEGRTEIYVPNLGSVENILVSNYDLIGDHQSLNFNLRYKYENDRGIALLVDFDLLDYINPSTADQPNFLFDSEGEQILEEDIFISENDNSINYWNLKGDFEAELAEGELKIGVKHSQSSTDNDYKFYREVDEMRILDLDRTNRFIYSEDLAAGYFIFNQEREKYNLSIGLRGELTSSKGDLLNIEGIKEIQFKRQYLDFFPSAGISWELSNNQSIQFNYSRRVKRPPYEDLNPFEIQKDELNIEKGNYSLSPEYTEKLSFTHGLNYQVYTSLNYSRTTGKIVSLRDTVPGLDIIVKQPLNLAENRQYSLNISISNQINRWWSNYSSFSGSYKQNFSDDERIPDVSAESFYIYSQQIFTLPEEISLELSGWYNSPSIFGASYESDAIWSLDIGIRKKFWDKRARLSLSVSDIFLTSGWYGISRFEGLTVTSGGNSDSRRFSVYFSYLFGSKKVKESKFKIDEIEEEERISSEESDKG